MPKTWRRSAAKRPRVVLSVAFSSEDSDAVNRAAEALNTYTSAFVRGVAVDRARRVIGEPVPAPTPTRMAVVTGFGGDHLRTSVGG